MRKICAWVFVFVFALGCAIQAAPNKKKPGMELQKKIGKLFALADKLEISDEQLLQLRETFRKRREENRELANQIKTDRKSFRKAMKARNLEELAELAPRIGRAQGARIQNNLEFALMLRNILTPVQWEKIKLMRTQMMLKKLRDRQKMKKVNVMKKLCHMRRIVMPQEMPGPGHNPMGFGFPPPPPPNMQQNMGHPPFMGPNPSFHENRTPRGPMMHRNRPMDPGEGMRPRGNWDNCPQGKDLRTPPFKGPRQGAVPQIHEEREVVMAEPIMGSSSPSEDIRFSVMSHEGDDEAMASQPILSEASEEEPIVEYETVLEREEVLK